MKIAITGHTKGIGKAIFDKLSIKHEMLGYSRSNGYDVKNYKTILSEIKSVDIFINNTYLGDFQEKIFLELFSKWKNESKTIVNLLNASTIINPQTSLKYSRDKTNFFNTVRNTLIDNPTKKCRVINLLPSTIEPNPMYPESKVKLDPKVIAEHLAYILELPQNIEITCLVISPTVPYSYTNTII